MNDTERLDLLIKILEKYELDICIYGCTFWPKSISNPALVQEFYPTVRDLLEAVKEYQ